MFRRDVRSEAEALKYDGFSATEAAALKGKEETHQFQAEVCVCARL